MPLSWTASALPVAGPGAAFLDLGSGVAALDAAICRIWPAVHVVGLEQ
ncbi:MAG: hypothetical protein M3256_16895 [Actinomycetota bacterium]|nr:hypothetical protein [Actinomycetota bacterium]